MQQIQKNKIWQTSLWYKINGFIGLAIVIATVAFNSFYPNDLISLGKASISEQTQATLQQAKNNTKEKNSSQQTQQAQVKEQKNPWATTVSAQKLIAITFDDGPHPTNTVKILDALKERSIIATFFVVGQNAKKYPELIRREVAEGHEIGNHSWNHPFLPRLSAEKIKSSIENTQNAIFEIVDYIPTIMRPPYGGISKRVSENVGMPMILWSVDPLDWKTRSGPTTIKRVLRSTHPGSIILLHDIHTSTANAVPELLDKLINEGYHFVTVSELLDFNQNPSLAVPGKIYSAAPKI